MEDTIINYILYRTAKSFYFLTNIGYYYTANTQSITNNLFKIFNIRIKFLFFRFGFQFDHSKNTKFEKDMVNHLLSYINKNFNLVERLPKLFFSITDLKNFNNIINKYLKCKFITKENKYLMIFFYLS